jgi:hypothetical protein
VRVTVQRHTTRVIFGNTQTYRVKIGNQEG